MIGRTLSHYKILEKLGSGGMGDVYVAEDTTLDRQVALKTLSPEYASNAERRERFEREAKAVAALNHPHIVTLHSVEEAEGVHFITMELVKGKTLTELISKKALPLNTFLDIAIPMADAVSAAHERGIVHRDLKPDNLMVGEDGRLKILDFGLAKLKREYVDSSISDLPTQPQTQEGRILGTVAYMSPEQAEGKPVDHRSDIFTLGIILYEMATGERPFRGDTTASILSSIIKDTPALATEVNPGLPRDLGKMIRRCLVKEPTRRYQTALDLRNELEELKHDLDSGEVLDQAPAPASKPKRNWLLHAALVVAVVVLGVIAYQMRLGEVTEEVTESSGEVTLTRVTSQPGQELFPTLSPDGEFFAYASRASGNWDIYLQRIEGEKAINLTSSSEEDDTMPAFSPDGKQIAFRSEREGGGLFLMGATGESVRRLTDDGYNPTWSPDGSHLAYVTVANWRPHTGTTQGQLWVVDVITGSERLISKSARQASWSPGGNRIAYWTITGGLRDIWTIPVVGGKATAVTNDSHVDWNPVWSRDGNFLYFSSDRSGSMNLWRVRVDEESGKVLEKPDAVTTGGATSRQHMNFSQNGTRAVYVEELISSNIWKTDLDLPEGVTEREPTPITRGSKRFLAPVISPDGNWLAYQTIVEQEDIFVARVDGTEGRQLTNDLHKDRTPKWSPNSRRISFYSNRNGSYEIWSIRRDGSDLVQHTNTPDQSVSYHSWSPDGSRMAFYSNTEKKSYIIDLRKTWEEQVPVTLPPFENGVEPFTVYSWSSNYKSIVGWTRSSDGSPNGIATYDLESKQYKRFTNSGAYPIWLSDNRRVIFGDAGKILMVDTQSGRVREILSLPHGRVGDEVSVSPTDQWIYFVQVLEEADIWMLEFDQEN